MCRGCSGNGQIREARIARLLELASSGKVSSNTRYTLLTTNVHALFVHISLFSFNYYYSIPIILSSMASQTQMSFMDAEPQPRSSIESRSVDYLAFFPFLSALTN